MKDYLEHIIFWLIFFFFTELCSTRCLCWSTLPTPSVSSTQKKFLICWANSPILALCIPLTLSLTCSRSNFKHVAQRCQKKPTHKPIILGGWLFQYLLPSTSGLNQTREPSDWGLRHFKTLQGIAVSPRTKPPVATTATTAWRRFSLLPTAAQADVGSGTQVTKTVTHGRHLLKSSWCSASMSQEVRING